jgi:hypothetical protein
MIYRSRQSGVAIPDDQKGEGSIMEDVMLFARRWGLCCCLILLLPPWSLAQTQEAGTEAPSAGLGEESSEGPRVSNSSVGYIDPAIPGNIVRLRIDDAFHNRQPSRAEFFYARPGPNGRGLPLPESNADYQDIATYVERVFGHRFSAFVNLPVRFANFKVNDNHSGFADMNAGFKLALLYSENAVGTLQFRTYLPTGNARNGLGNHHVSFEPSFLLYLRLTERLVSENEFRVWVPVGGTPGFQGEMVRYGTGLRYNILQTSNWTLAPVVEVVGWTFLDGIQDETTRNSAAGDTIVNLKSGFRIRFRDRADFYAGYGRALTGEVLYEDIYRVEWRLFY